MNLEKPGKPKKRVVFEFWKVFVLFKIALFKNKWNLWGKSGKLLKFCSESDKNREYFNDRYV